jgi:cytochrome c oxidase cbb3-type subunit 4
MDYETAASLFSTGGLIYFLLLFIAVLAYALWPGNKAKFDRAARMPLEED